MDKYHETNPPTLLKSEVMGRLGSQKHPQTSQQTITMSEALTEEQAATKARQEREKRQDSARKSIVDGEREVAGYRLRPFAFGSNTLAREMGLSMFYERDEEKKKNITEDESLRQMAGFIWMQSEDIDDVLDSLADGTWEAKVKRFSLTLPLHHLPEIMDEVERISDLAAQAAVDVEKQDGDGDKGAPGNS